MNFFTKFLIRRRMRRNYSASGSSRLGVYNQKGISFKKGTRQRAKFGWSKNRQGGKSWGFTQRFRY